MVQDHGSPPFLSPNQDTSLSKVMKIILERPESLEASPVPRQPQEAVQSVSSLCILWPVCLPTGKHQLALILQVLIWESLLSFLLFLPRVSWNLHTCLYLLTSFSERWPLCLCHL